MPHMVVYDHSKSEIDLLRNWMATIYEAKDELMLHDALTLEELLQQLRALDEIFFCCADFEVHGEQAIHAIRERDISTLLAIIVEVATPPLAYIRPHIMAAGILLRPLTKAQAEPVLREIVEAATAKARERLLKHEVFVFSTREGSIRVPYAQILYFEARNKKIVLCTERTETEFYGTLESLVLKIPDYFLRCHKGFIVNKYFIDRMELGKNSLYLTGGFQIPISRSYKELVKETLS